MEPAGVTTFCLTRASKMSCAFTPRVAMRSYENSTKIRSGRSPRMLTFLNPCDVQQILAKRLRFSGKETQRELAGFQGVHGKFNVGILVVQHRRQNPLRQLRCLVLNLFSALIELFGNLVGRRVVKKRDREKGKPGPRERIDVVVIFELLHALFERLRDQILHFLRGCSGHAAATVNTLIVNVGSSARPSVRYATAPAMMIARRKNKVTERSRTARAERLNPCTPAGFFSMAGS